MRITQNYTNRSYLRNNNKILSNYTNSMEKIWSGKDYFRASDNAINASKAMTVRKSLRDLDMYDDNLNTASEVFNAAESNLYSITSNIYLTVQTKLEQACNGTYNQEDLDIIANELKQFAAAAVQTLNSDFAERRLFGGTNNSSPAFATETDENGRTYVTYNGIRVDDMVEDKAGNLCYYTRITEAEYNDAIAAGDPDSVLRKGIPGSEVKIEDEPAKTAEEQYNELAAADPDKYETDGNGNYYEKVQVSEAEFKAAGGDPDFVDNGDGTYYRKVSLNLADIPEKTAKEKYDELLAADPDSVYAETDSDGTVTYYRQQYAYYSADMTEVPASKPIYVDIGIGIKYDENGAVDEQTALDISFNGAKITGFGTDEDEGNNDFFSRNFVQLIYDAAAALEKGDTAFANATLDRLNTANSGILTEITTIGAKQNSIEFYISKNSEYRMSLQSRQNDVEGCDMETEIIQMESLEAAYNATLQLNAQLIPNSIFNFI